LAIFHLTYDLNHEDGITHYETLRKELTRLRAHQVLSNSCLINLNTASARRLIEAIKPLIEESDRLFAVRVEPQSYWYINARAETNEWLKNNPAVALADEPTEGAATGSPTMN